MQSGGTEENVRWILGNTVSREASKCAMEQVHRTTLHAPVLPATSKTIWTFGYGLFFLSNIIRMVKMYRKGDCTRKSRQNGGGFWSWLTTNRDTRRNRRRDILNTIGNEPDPIGSEALTDQTLRFEQPSIQPGQCSKSGASNALAEAISNIGRARSGIEYYISNTSPILSDPNDKFLDSALVELSQAIKTIQLQQNCVRAAQGGRRRTRRRRGNQSRK